MLGEAKVEEKGGREKEKSKCVKYLIVQGNLSRENLHRKIAEARSRWTRETALIPESPETRESESGRKAILSKLYAREGHASTWREKRKLCSDIRVFVSFCADRLHF